MQRSSVTPLVVSGRSATGTDAHDLTALPADELTRGHRRSVKRAAHRADRRNWRDELRDLLTLEAFGGEL